MWEFIVLGQVPGINIQINFWAWLAIVPPALLFAFALWRVRKQKTLNFWLIAFNLYFSQLRMAKKHA
jgi:hypothetical protein